MHGTLLDITIAQKQLPPSPPPPPHTHIPTAFIALSISVYGILTSFPNIVALPAVVNVDT